MRRGAAILRRRLEGAVVTTSTTLMVTSATNCKPLLTLVVRILFACVLTEKALLSLAVPGEFILRHSSCGRIYRRSWSRYR